MKTQNATIDTNVRQFAAKLGYSLLAILLMGICPLRIMAQGDHLHAAASQHATAQQDQADSLVKIVRDSTERFNNVNVAIAEGYALQFGCVSGDGSGAMGLHYVNANLVNSGVLDATRPHIVIYEAIPGGGLKLIGADYLLIASTWNATHSGPPQLMGQLFHLFDSPNRFGLPAFYTLHVWAWKDNPNGAFVNWHPNVSCQSFAGQNQ
jgi:hypothetical protein